ncbi:hypothetical protein L195_g001145 [Trifolium pratense]|uniref:Uncharacterized protein n=1 Tax=Trifolium pratense TaxID=57577 RepID=A0A2K3NNW7_TRIPR|nr:hypothetical protein L195_g001145 [Trifolium pratense]
MSLLLTFPIRCKESSESWPVTRSFMKIPILFLFLTLSAQHPLIYPYNIHPIHIWKQSLVAFSIRGRIHNVEFCFLLPVFFDNQSAVALPCNPVLHDQWPDCSRRFYHMKLNVLELHMVSHPP